MKKCLFALQKENRVAVLPTENSIFRKESFIPNIDKKKSGDVLTSPNNCSYHFSKLGGHGCLCMRPPSEQESPITSIPDGD